MTVDIQKKGEKNKLWNYCLCSM